MKLKSLLVVLFVFQAEVSQAACELSHDYNPETVKKLLACARQAPYFQHHNMMAVANHLQKYIRTNLMNQLVSDGANLSEVKQNLSPEELQLIEEQNKLVRIYGLRNKLNACYSGETYDQVQNLLIAAAQTTSDSICSAGSYPLEHGWVSDITTVVHNMEEAPVMTAFVSESGQKNSERIQAFTGESERIFNMRNAKAEIHLEALKNSLKNRLLLENRFNFEPNKDKGKLVDSSLNEFCMGHPGKCSEMAYKELLDYGKGIQANFKQTIQPLEISAVRREICSAIERAGISHEKMKLGPDPQEFQRLIKMMNGNASILLMTDVYKKRNFRFDCKSKTLGYSTEDSFLRRAFNEARDHIRDHAKHMTKLNAVGLKVGKRDDAENVTKEHEESLGEMMAYAPSQAGKVMLDNPAYAKQSCDILKAYNQKKKDDEAFNQQVMWGSAITGLALSFTPAGWALLGTAADLAVAGVAYQSAVSNQEEVLGAITTDNMGAGVFQVNGSGQKMMDESQRRVDNATTGLIIAGAAPVVAPAMGQIMSSAGNGVKSLAQSGSRRLGRLLHGESDMARIAQEGVETFSDDVLRSADNVSAITSRSFSEAADNLGTLEQQAWKKLRPDQQEEILKRIRARQAAQGCGL